MDGRIPFLHHLGTSHCNQNLLCNLLSSQLSKQANNSLSVCSCVQTADRVNFSEQLPQASNIKPIEIMRMDHLH